MSVAQIYNSAQARSTILRRVQWEDQEMPASVLDGIERIFGAADRAGGGGRAHPAGCPGAGRCGAARVGAADRPAIARPAGSSGRGVARGV